MNSNSNRISSEIEEPQITSPDPEERILARRLRIQKRNAVAKKRLQAIEEGEAAVSSEQQDTILETQVERSTVELLTLTQEGRELITNVQVASDAHEVKRRADQAAAKEARMKKLEDEANIAQQKFDRINEKWESIAVLNDPLDLHQETEMQREKCMDLITQKDQLIADLKAELKGGDIRFVKDQQKQADDIALLVERIDSQIAIMRRAYRRELNLIEQAIDMERKETMEVNKKRWETLYKQREEDEIVNLEQRFVALTEHNQLMQNILVHHQEKFRASKISLEKDIQVLQQQLEQVKSICLLNKEKMEYNYQVLKKRDEESLLIRSQQKRRINKLQDVVAKLRRKLLAMDQTTQTEVKRLTSEVIKLHRNIKDIQLKAEHFCTVNETKYFQLWKFNHDSAQKLLDKILSIDRLVYEQHLGLSWLPIPPVGITKKDLPSYRAAIEKQTSEFQKGSNGFTQINEPATERLLHHILEAVADKSGFLLEEQLSILLAPYTQSQNTLVRIDNVFSALGVTRIEDMDLLRQTMEPYMECVTCRPILKAINPVSPPTMPTPPVLSEEEMKSRVLKKLQDTLEEGEKATLIKDERLSVKEEQEPEECKMSDATGELQTTSSTITPWVFSTFELPQSSSQEAWKSTAPSWRVFTVTFSSGRHLTPFFAYSSSILESPSFNPPASQTVLTESQVDDKEVEDVEDEEEMKTCHDPSHEQSINPIYVLKALREFVQKFQTKKLRQGHVWGEKVEGGKSISRQLADEDVKYYWEQFRDAFSPEREKLWDCLYMGLQRYHTVLQERHKINSEIEQLKVQNAELRRLLQKYALPNNMKPAKGSRQNLPPLSIKTSSAPAPTPARLVLTFNNSSRL